MASRKAQIFAIPRPATRGRPARGQRVRGHRPLHLRPQRHHRAALQRALTPADGLQALCSRFPGIDEHEEEALEPWRGSKPRTVEKLRQTIYHWFEVPTQACHVRSSPHSALPVGSRVSDVRPDTRLPDGAIRRRPPLILHTTPNHPYGILRQGSHRTEVDPGLASFKTPCVPVERSGRRKCRTRAARPASRCIGYWPTRLSPIVRTVKLKIAHARYFHAGNRAVPSANALCARYPSVSYGSHRSRDGRCAVRPSG
jgi:hypothetical protein